MEKTRMIRYITCDCCGNEESNNIEINGTYYPDVHICTECQDMGWEVLSFNEIEREVESRGDTISLKFSLQKYGFVQGGDMENIRWTEHTTTIF